MRVLQIGSHPVAQLPSAGTGSGEQQLHRRVRRERRDGTVPHHLAEPAERARRERRELAHRVETRLELRDDRPSHVHGGVAPTPRDAVTGVLGRDVEATQHRVRPIAGQHFAVIAKRAPQPALRVEQDDIHAGIAQRHEEILAQTFGPEGIQQHGYDHAARPRAQQCIAQPGGGTLLTQQIGFQSHGMDGVIDETLHLCKGFVDRGYPARRMRAMAVQRVLVHSSVAGRNSTPNDRSLRYRWVRSMPTRLASCPTLPLHNVSCCCR